MRYLLAWKGFKNHSYEPASNLNDPINILEEFFIDYIGEKSNVLDFKRHSIKVHGACMKHNFPVLLFNICLIIFNMLNLF